MVDLRIRSTIGRLMRRTQNADTLYLDSGVVHCPRRGDIELEICLACPALERVDGDPIHSLQCSAHTNVVGGRVTPL
jgi:hypothetical protein